MSINAAVARTGMALGLAAVLAGPVLPAETPKFATILYGASYYWEYMPTERLEKDFELNPLQGPPRGHRLSAGQRNASLGDIRRPCPGRVPGASEEEVHDPRSAQ